MIFVTGATGLVGSHLLVRLSNQNRKLRALRRISSDLQLVKRIFQLYAQKPEEQFAAIEWVEGDLMDIFALEDFLIGVDEVYHCAAIVSFNAVDKKQLFAVNINGTANIVNASLTAGVEKFCYVSSIAALGSAEHPKMIDENSLWKSSKRNSVYGISKYGAEREVWRGIAEGLNATIVNPSVILGLGDWKTGSSELFTLVWKGLKFYTLGTKGFVDVRDVAKAMTTLMDGNHFGERFVVSAETLSFKQLFDYIARYLHKKAPSIEAKLWIGAIAWRVMAVKGFLTGTKPAITRETVRSANNLSAYSSAKLIRTAGFEFIPIEQSIQDIGEIFLQDHL
jgi:nucleoside-diphosphate-sugar epimerase